MRGTRRRRQETSLRGPTSLPGVLQASVFRGARLGCRGVIRRRASPDVQGSTHGTDTVPRRDSILRRLMFTRAAKRVFSGSDLLAIERSRVTHGHFLEEKYPQRPVARWFVPFWHGHGPARRVPRVWHLTCSICLRYTVKALFSGTTGIPPVSTEWRFHP